MSDNGNRKPLPPRPPLPGNVKVAPGPLPRSPHSLLSKFTLDQITDQGQRLPDRIILHARPGWGKTSFAAQAEGVIFLMVDQETGLLTLMKSGQLGPTKHFPEVARDKAEILEALTMLATENHPYQRLAIDGGSPIEQILARKVCTEQFKGNWGNGGYASFDAGPKATAPEWDEILRALDALIAKGMGVILLCHSKVSVMKNPSGSDYTHWTPELSKYSWERLFQWADAVLFGDFETFVTDEGKGRKGKASGGQHRIMIAEHTATAEAKNRHGLPEEIDGGSSAAEAWANFQTALKHE